MSGAVHPAHLDHHRRPNRHSWVRSSFRSLLLRLGFEERVRSHWATDARQVSPSTHVRKTAIAMPKDYIRRRRMSRNISNFVIVVLLSAGAAYVITRPTGGNGFSLS